MTAEETEKTYPIRTLHKLLLELNRDWRLFKRGTLMSIIILSILLAASIPLFIRIVRLGLGIGEVIFAIFFASFLIYSIRIMIMQYRFFRRWGQRMKQLSTLEEKLLNESATSTPQQ
jgi:membrane protein implicated in regulation of membrane protease activity